ncbi:MAG: beta-1,6-N-acetylglucosaminyltransferase [Pseudomonadota bacterium]
MSVGIVMLVHEPLGRAAEVARFWAEAGCPIVIHVDKRVPKRAYETFEKALGDLSDIVFCDRWTCEWGTWSLVAASQTAATVMLDRFPNVRHIYLASGTCLPLRPVEELREFLDAHPHTDFIESVTTRDVPWTIGGLDAERFTLRFPFAWKSQRRLFDASVGLQRALNFSRKIPEGITPHLGSQWWCLTRQTVSAILEDPARATFERYFRQVWIPDESYWQTLVRRYGRHVESRSLTLSKFDHQGKPHVFYDDHLQLLRRSDCFVARKIWPGANKLYATFLGPGLGVENRAQPSPGSLDRVFSRALDRRMRGRAGLYMQSRYPRWDWENGKSAAPYHVLCGFGDLFDGFPEWLTASADCLTHGHLYAPDRAEFAGGKDLFAGCLPDSAALRDHNTRAFLANLLWNTRGERQCFLFGPRDHQHIAGFFTYDPNARVTVISGAWAVPLLRQNRNFGELREEAARLQKTESRFLDLLRGPHTKARVQIWTMAAFLEDPIEHLTELLEEIGPRDGHGAVIEAPRMRRLDGFAGFLQTLKNQGMHPHVMGEFPLGFGEDTPPERGGRPYVVK